jgi:hypothetical protein
MEWFVWFENTALSTWVRESPPVFPTILILHALGLGALVGVSVMHALRALGVVRNVAMESLHAFGPLLWIGFVVNLVSGILLLAAYPAKALTNAVFYVKFACIAAAFIAVSSLRRSELRGMDEQARRVRAVAVLLSWAGAITAGRLLAYTHHVLLASHL